MYIHIYIFKRHVHFWEALIAVCKDEIEQVCMRGLDGGGMHNAVREVNYIYIYLYIY